MGFTLYKSLFSTTDPTMTITRKVLAVKTSLSVRQYKRVCPSSPPLGIGHVSGFDLWQHVVQPEYEAIKRVFMLGRIEGCLSAIKAM